MSSYGVTGTGNADAKMGISTAMTTIAPRGINFLVNESDIFQ